MAALNTTTAALRKRIALCELRKLENATRTLSRAHASSNDYTIPKHARRTLHTTPTLSKKSRQPGWQGVKGAPARIDFLEKQRAGSKPSPSSSSEEAAAGKHPSPEATDPLNFADVKSRMASHDERALDLLKKMKSGGRFNPDLIGAVPVVPDRKEAPGASFPLRELAQVVPKGGRTISILVYDKESIKPIMSAIQASPDFNQQPQRDPDNELELVLKMELEKRDDVVKRVKAVCHEWRERVRGVRQKRDKTHSAWKKDGLILPDLKKKADTELEKLIKAKMGEIEAAEKEGIKAAEGKS